MAGAWRDGREDDSVAGGLMQSAAAADAALRKLSEAAAAAEARHAEVVEARRQAARGMSARGGAVDDEGPAGPVGVGEREAATARMNANKRRHPRSSARGPNPPSRGRRAKPIVPEKELQRLRDATELYEKKRGKGEEGVVVSEASEGRVARGSS